MVKKGLQGSDIGGDQVRLNGGAGKWLCRHRDAWSLEPAPAFPYPSSRGLKEGATAPRKGQTRSSALHPWSFDRTFHIYGGGNLYHSNCCQ